MNVVAGLGHAALAGALGDGVARPRHRRPRGRRRYSVTSACAATRQSRIRARFRRERLRRLEAASCDSDSRRARSPSPPRSRRRSSSKRSGSTASSTATPARHHLCRGRRDALRRSTRGPASVAVYAPRGGGAAAVLMGAVPAKIAGVPGSSCFRRAAGDGFGPPCALRARFAASTNSMPPAARMRSPRRHSGRGRSRGRQNRRTAAVSGRRKQSVKYSALAASTALAGPAEVLVLADDGANSEYVLGEFSPRRNFPA